MVLLGILYALLIAGLLVGGSWAFADAGFSAGIPFFESTIKIREAGFADCIDSHRMFAEHLADLQARRILPP